MTAAASSRISARSAATMKPGVDRGVQRRGEAFEVFGRAAGIEPAHACRRRTARRSRTGTTCGLSSGARPDVRGDRDVHPRGADTALGEPVLVEIQLRRISVGQGDGMCGGRGLTGADPVVQARDGRLQHVVVLRGEIDGVRQLCAHQLAGRCVRRDDLFQRRRSVVDEADADGVVVGVRGAGNLPRAQSFVVGPARQVIAHPAAADEVGFGDDSDDRYAQVGPERHGLRGRFVLLERCWCCPTARRGRIANAQGSRRRSRRPDRRR